MSSEHSEYSSIHESFEWLKERCGTAIELMIEDYPLYPGEAGEYYLDVSFKLLKKAVCQRTKTLVLVNCEGFLRRNEYPRGLIVSAMKNVLKKLDSQTIAKEWSQRGLGHSEKDKREVARCLDSWSSVFRIEAEESVGRLAVFDKCKFSLERALANRELRKLYRSKHPTDFTSSSAGLTPTQAAGLDVAIMFELIQRAKSTQGKRRSRGKEFLNQTISNEKTLFESFHNWYRKETRYARRFYKEDGFLINKCLQPSSAIYKIALQKIADGERDNCKPVKILTFGLPYFVKGFPQTFPV